MPLTDTRCRLWTLLIDGVLMVAPLSFHIVATIAQPGWRWGMADLEVYRAAVASMLQAQPLYQEGFTPANLSWLYPPFAAVLMMPWAVLPEVAAKTVMTAASVAALVLLMAQSWAATAVPRAWRPGLVLTCAAVVLVSEPMQQNLIMGQINVLLAAAVVHDFLRPAGDRRRGWLVGLAAGVKLTPALIVIYYAFRREWSAVRNASLAFVGSVVIGFVVVPGESWTYWTRALWSSRIGPDHLGNQSLLGTLLRLAANTGWTSLFWLVSAGGVAVAGIWLAVQRQADPLASYCTLAAAILLISPLSWTPHWISLSPVLVLAMSRCRRPAGLISVLAAYGLFMFAWPVDGVWSGLIWTVYPADLWPEVPPSLRVAGRILVGSSYTVLGLAVLAVGFRNGRQGPAGLSCAAVGSPVFPGEADGLSWRPQQDSNLRHKV